MPIFQYKCDNCLSVFEHYAKSADDKSVSCVSCGSKGFKRVRESVFVKMDGCGGCGGGCDSCPVRS